MNDDNVVNIASRRPLTIGPALEHVCFDSVDVGIANDDTPSIIVMRRDGHGIYMSHEDAAKLGVALIEAVSVLRWQLNGGGE